MCGLGIAFIPGRDRKFAGLLEKELLDRKLRELGKNYLLGDTSDNDPKVKLADHLSDTDSDEEADYDSNVAPAPKDSVRVWHIDEAHLTTSMQRARDADWLGGTIRTGEVLEIPPSTMPEFTIIYAGTGKLGVQKGTENKDGVTTEYILNQGDLVSVPAGHRCYWTAEETVLRYWQAIDTHGDPAELVARCDVCRVVGTVSTTFTEGNQRRHACEKSACADQIKQNHPNARIIGNRVHAVLPSMVSLAASEPEDPRNQATGAAPMSALSSSLTSSSSGSSPSPSPGSLTTSPSSTQKAKKRRQLF